MKKPVRNSGLNLASLRAMIMLLIFILPTIGCSGSAPAIEDSSLRDTQQAVFVQETMAAMNAAAVSTQSASIAATSARMAAQENEFAQATIQAQQTIIAGQLSAIQTIEPTQTPQVTLALPTLPPTSAPAGALPGETIVVTDWKMSRFAQINSGCYFPNQVCWKGDDKYTFEQNGIINLTLSSREPVFVDPSWSNPYLLFWHKFSIPRYATISINADGRWSLMGTYTGKQDWALSAIPLELFKEKNIKIQFLAEGKPFAYDPKADWYIQDIKIIPDYKP